VRTISGFVIPVTASQKFLMPLCWKRLITKHDFKGVSDVITLKIFYKSVRIYSVQGLSTVLGRILYFYSAFLKQNIPSTYTLFDSN
jgi:hypothetical protein